MIISRRAREVILSSMLLAIPVVLLYGNMGRPWSLNFIDRIVLRTVGWTQHQGVAGANWVAAGWDRYVTLWDLKRRNADLRRRNAELRRNNEILSVWAGRGRTLEQKLGFATAPRLRMVPTLVTARGLSPFFQVLKISRPTAPRAMRVGRAVAVPEGVVGRVRRVYGRYGDVLLITDVESVIKVSVRRSASRGELRGTGRGRRLLGRIEYLSPRDAVQVGDEIITSSMAGRYPRDLRVGRVRRVIERVKGQYQRVEVETAIDPGRLSRVYLVVSRRKEAAKPGPRPLGSATPSGSGPGVGTPSPRRNRRRRRGRPRRAQ